MNTTVAQNTWKEYSYELGENFLSEDTLKIALSSLLHKELASLPNNNYILIQLKIRTIEKGYKSISYLQRAMK